MKKQTLPIIFLLALSLFSCAEKDSTAQPNGSDISAIQTDAVATFASSLTETLIVVPQASPTLTSLPTFTPPASSQTPETPTEKAVNPCYKLLWLRDLTIQDGTVMKANEKFTKTWLVQNNGGCAWAPGFSFNHVGGDPMRGQKLTIKEPVPVGLKYEVSIELVVPSGINGLIQSSWQMADVEGNYFGDTLTVNIVVGSLSTPTP